MASAAASEAMVGSISYVCTDDLRYHDEGDVYVIKGVSMHCAYLCDGTRLSCTAISTTLTEYGVTRIHDTVPILFH